jgi:hypothetical protein
MHSLQEISDQNEALRCAAMHMRLEAAGVTYDSREARAFRKAASQHRLHELNEERFHMPYFSLRDGSDFAMGSSVQVQLLGSRGNDHCSQDFHWAVGYHGILTGRRSSSGRAPGCRAWDRSRSGGEIRSLTSSTSRVMATSSPDASTK